MAQAAGWLRQQYRIHAAARRPRLSLLKNKVLFNRKTELESRFIKKKERHSQKLPTLGAPSWGRL
ncbi:MAG: hypothetical protein B7Y39_08785 [Bdellovibrio sp. 28-41-41]|nr:MAG: hypothetical protein B7Y39_08785 [Bdellovibrio sp. 28-41-41]